MGDGGELLLLLQDSPRLVGAGTVIGTAVETAIETAVRLGPRRFVWQDDAWLVG